MSFALKRIIRSAPSLESWAVPVYTAPLSLESGEVLSLSWASLVMQYAPETPDTASVTSMSTLRVFDSYHLAAL